MSASGYMIFSGTQAPWSSPRLRVLVHLLGSGSSAGHLRGPARGVGGVVAQGVVHRVEAAEVVDELVGPGGADAQRCGLPVRARRQDRLRLRQRPRPVVQRRQPVRASRTASGAAVAEVQARQRAVVRGPGPVRLLGLERGDAAQVRGERVVGRDPGVGGGGGVPTADGGHGGLLGGVSLDGRSGDDARSRRSRRSSRAAARVICRKPRASSSRARFSAPASIARRPPAVTIPASERLGVGVVAGDEDGGRLAADRAGGQGGRRSWC